MDVCKCAKWAQYVSRLGFRNFTTPFGTARRRPMRFLPRLSEEARSFESRGRGWVEADLKILMKLRVETITQVIPLAD